MARRCDLTGKGGKAGNNVSHSNHKTKRRFQPNLQPVSLWSEALGRPVSLRISTRALRTVQKRGGLDGFLLKSRDEELAEAALRLKRKVRRALSGGPSQRATA